MTDPRPPKGRGLWARLARARPTKPGEIYGVPGQGNTFWLSVASVLALLVLWWLVTALGLVKPLFVPSPQLVLAVILAGRVVCHVHILGSVVLSSVVRGSSIEDLFDK